MIHACFIIVYACNYFVAARSLASVSVPRARAVLRRFCARELVSGAPPHDGAFVCQHCAQLVADLFGVLFGVQRGWVRVSDPG
jgi:hypothetical protein